MTTAIAAKIRESLLESPYVGDVLQISVGTSEPDSTALVGMRVSVANVATVDDLGPVVAEFRATAREHAGEDACVYVEIAVNDEPNPNVSTESIVIRGED